MYYKMSPRREDGVDRLSCLDKEILTHILSLLPTKFAVRTSILSKRWRYRWTWIHNLDFDDIHPVHDECRFTKFVDRVLGLCKTSHIDLFRLHCTEIYVPTSTVSNWIDEAVSLNVKELDIQVIMLELPLSMFTCKTLTKLRLVLSRDDIDLWEFPSNIELPCLKTFDIKVYNKPSVNAFRVIPGCPILESLSLEVTWPYDEEDYIFNIPTLKRLELRIPRHRDQVIKKVVLNLPNLECFVFGGMLGSQFVMEDLSSLVEATVSTHGMDNEHLKVELLKELSGVKSLSWSTSYSDVPLSSPLPNFPNLKHLGLKAPFSSGWLPLFQVLENSSGLEHLCVEKEECRYGMVQKAEESCWIEPQSVPSCMLSNLRTMKIERFMGQKCDIGFLGYMLGNSQMLRKLTITCGKLPLKEENRLCAELLKFPRASRSCQIHFSGNQSHSAGK